MENKSQLFTPNCFKSTIVLLLLLLLFSIEILNSTQGRILIGGMGSCPGLEEFKGRQFEDAKISSKTPPRK
uniref:Putative secreted protein n=1 Tax=Ixodes ricinus TaxID=34613 RepID=A0A6B0U1Z4_IXORI